MRERLAYAFMGGSMAITLVAMLMIPVTVHESQSQPLARVVAPKPIPTPALSVKEQVLLGAFHHGWLGNEWNCLERLITLENRHWSPNVKNPHSSATGIFQVITSPSGRVFRDYSITDQVRLGINYIIERYQTPCRALAFHLVKGWF